MLTDDVMGYERDWTGRYRGRTPAVVRPGSTAEVADVLRYCDQRSIAVVPQGGNTGLVGGGVPCEGEIVLSTTRLGGFSVRDDYLLVGAGVTLGEAQTHLAPHGREVPVDLGARDSATLGGMTSTNAGGNMAFRFGRMSHLVVGATVVTAGGDILTGDEAVWLSVGLEGTGSVVAEVTLRTRPLPRSKRTALVQLDSAEEVVTVAASLREVAPELVAAEYMASATVRLVASVLERPVPLDITRGHLLLVEMEDLDDDALGDALAASGVRDVLIAQDDRQRAGLWRLRDHLTEALQVAGPPLKLDVRVATDRVADFLAWLEEQDAPHVFGHILEGNLHVNITGLPPEEHHGTARRIIAAAVEYGGRVAGEHGIGRTKAPLLDLEPERAAIERFHSMKARFDPNRILNPALTVPIYEIA